MVASAPLRSLRSILLFLLLAFSVAASAQIDNVYVYGTVKDYNTSKKLDGINVTVFKDGAKLSSVVTSANGKYEFNLDYGYEYKLLFDKPGMVGKNVTINTRSIPDEDRVGGLAMNVEMTLFADIPGIDYKVLQQPIGKSKYDPQTHMLAWDLEYTEQMRAELDRLQKEYDDKKKREANAVEAFTKLMDQGNAAMAAKDYKKAVQSFTDALGLKAGDPIATAKLSDAQIKLTELTQAEAKAKQYADLIKEADGLFGKKSYDDAKTKYAAASALKEEEAYPKQKIKECDAFIADLAKQAEEEKKNKELNDKFNAAVAAGDAAFKAAKYDDAKTKFTEAAGLKPAEKYPPQQLAAIAAKLDELAKKAQAEKELEATYLAAIKAADAAFQGAKYDEAKVKYNEALEIKPKEKYPMDQLAAIEKKLVELAAKEEAAKKAKDLDMQYQAAISAADASFKGADYDAAKIKYNEAIGLKPKEKYPADQLAAIAKTLAGLAAKAEADKKAKELDARYQALIDKAEGIFTAGKYEDAKAKFQEALGVKPGEAHPKERIVEIDAKLADLARQAEEQRKKAELDSKYVALITSADKKFDAQNNSEALNDYKNASGLKPDEQYPKDRIATINGLMDAQAKEQAEKDRLALEQQEKDAKYNTLVSQADKDFKAKSYDAATSGYTSALEVKPGEKHPTDQLAAIKSLLADQAVADSTKAAQDQAERARLAEEARLKAEADSLKAAQDAAEMARLEAERRSKSDAEADLKAQYDAAITKADKAFKSTAFDQAKQGYTEALSVKPDEQYPKDQLKAIESALADRLKAQQDAADAAERQRLADEEQRRRDGAAADSAQAALDRAKQARDAQQALDAQYARTILDADRSMAQKDYLTARGVYSQAMDIKPKETYPQVKIDQIDKLLAEQERMQRERDLALQQDTDVPPVAREASTADNRKEQEAEEFMREAREREEVEKYGRIKRLKALVEQQMEGHAAKAAERQELSARKNQEYVEGSEQLYQGSEDMRKRNATELEAFREALAQREKELRERGEQDSERAKAEASSKLADREQMETSRRDKHLGKVKVIAQQEQTWSTRKEDQVLAGKQRTDAARDEALIEAQQAEAMRVRGNTASDRLRELVDLQKQNQNVRTKQLVSVANDREVSERTRIDNITPNQPRSYADYNRNALAAQYPQGVTEESYTEGNKVIIRRVVVQGNKADEYSKVIAKWGTFYFKNGQSISDQIWSVDTGN